MSRTFRVADLFCGAGGSSTGALRAIRALGCEMDLVAVNHWPAAIATHSRNHPDARHHCIDLDAARPEQLVPEGVLDLLMASPECVFFSRARGGKPVNDQRRMSAWHVQRWASALDIRCILVENVPEFLDWGPLRPDGRPDRTRRGDYFQAWVKALWAMGYAVDWRLLNAADYGDATTRTRLFVQARKDGVSIRWPEPTHSPAGGTDLFGDRPRWRAAREVIDWTNPGRSLFARKRPLSLKTRLRIARGFSRFGGPLAPLYISLLDLPEDAADQPLPTVLTRDRLGVAVPVAEPFPVPNFGEAPGQPPRVHDVNAPLPAVTSHGAGALVAPLLVQVNHAGESDGRVRSVDVPLPTVTTKRSVALVEPLVLTTDQTGRGGVHARPVDAPIATLTTKNNQAIVRPLAVPDAGDGVDVDPRRLVLIDGVPHLLDIRFRMLTNRELARAMGFDDAEAEYEFTGNVGEVTRQIGNAVACGTAAALVRAALEEIRGAALQRTVTKADDGTVLSTGVYCCECDAEAAGDAPLLHNTMTGDCGWVAPCGIAQAALAGTAQE